MTRPDISSITVSQNPVNTKEVFKISVTVTEKEIVFKTVTEYAGEKYAGQEVGVI